MRQIGIIAFLIFLVGCVGVMVPVPAPKASLDPALLQKCTGICEDLSKIEKYVKPSDFEMCKRNCRSYYESGDGELMKIYTMQIKESRDRLLCLNDCDKLHDTLEIARCMNNC